MSLDPDPYTCVLDQETGTSLKLYLFKNVRNVGIIRSNIIKGVWKCAVIKPSLIVDPLQVAVAANKAVVSLKYNNMVTRTVYAEILYNLSLTKNISQSLSKFGIEKGVDLLIAFLDGQETDNSFEILPQIEGERCPIEELKNFTDMKELKSVYKLSNIDHISEGDRLSLIVSRMVTKGFVSH